MIDAFRSEHDTAHHWAYVYIFCVLRRSQKWLSCNEIVLDGLMEAVAGARKKPMTFFVVEVAQSNVTKAFQRRFSQSTLSKYPKSPIL